MSESVQSITPAKLAALLGAECIGGDGDGVITGVNTIADALPNEVSFLADPKYADRLADCRAAAVLVSKASTPCRTVQLVVKDVNRALIETLRFFAPSLTAFSGIDPTARVDAAATVDPSAAVGAQAVIGPGVSVGAHTVIGPGCVIGEGTTIGDRCRLDANVVVYHQCRIGNACVILANTTIGSTGFGYVFLDGQHQLIPHNGGVIIEDGVDIGANCCVDRAKFGNTVIGAGTKIDNLVQIGHNARIGRMCILVAGVALAGSCVLGDGVVLAGKVGVAEHIVVGHGAVVGARGTVTENIAPGQKVLGFPARPMRDEMKSMSIYRKLPELVNEVKRLSHKIETLETAKDH